jgi:uncharacterized protein YqjF (DUF2071 family)
MMEAARRTLSEEGRERLLSQRGEPLFLAGWERTLFVHYEVPAERLQRDVPFPLDLHEGRAYVSLVAFKMRKLHFRFGGPVLSWLVKPVATHGFLNARTYVKHGSERGIYFLTEWLSNWLSVQLGPLLYGLPYRYAQINCRHEHEHGRLSGRVEGWKTREAFDYEATCETDGFAACAGGTLDEFLVERYTAFTARGPIRRFFRIWHPPWPQVKVNISVREDSLVRRMWPWFAEARLVGANYSPGFAEVWMGRAQRVK